MIDRVFITVLSGESTRLNHVIKVLIASVLRLHDCLVGFLNLTGLAIVSEHSATLFTHESLLLLLTLPELPLGLAVEEGLNLVGVVVQLKLLLAHVWVSKAELFVLLVGISLLTLDVTEHLGVLVLVLPTGLSQASVLFDVSIVVIVRPVRLVVIAVVAARVLLVVVSLVRALVVGGSLGVGPVVVIVVVVATLMLLILLLLQGLLPAMLPGLVGVLLLIELSIVDFLFVVMLVTVKAVVRSLLNLVFLVLDVLSDLLVLSLVLKKVLLVLSPVGLGVRRVIMFMMDGLVIVVVAVVVIIVEILSEVSVVVMVSVVTMVILDKVNRDVISLKLFVLASVDPEALIIMN